MIRISREPEPRFLKSKRFRSFRKELGDFFEGGGTRKTQSTFAWQAELEEFFHEVYDDLAVQFNSKCAYTEVKLDHPANEDSERPAHMVLHRPGSDAVNFDGVPSPDHYWWLIPQWSNWFLASPHVSSVKENQFPVIGERAPVTGINEARVGNIEDAEKSLLLDPSSVSERDDPAWHLAFYRTGFVGARDVGRFRTHQAKRLPNNTELKGIHTIRALDLNSTRLLDQRQNEIALYLTQIRAVLRVLEPKDIDELWPKLDRLTAADRAFSAARCQTLVLEWAASLRKNPDTKIVAATGEYLINRHPSQLAASILCDGRYWEDGLPAISSKDTKVLLDHVDRIFPDTGTAEKLVQLLTMGTGVFPSTTIPPTQELRAETEIIRPVVYRTSFLKSIRVRNFRAIQDIYLTLEDIKEAELSVDLKPSYGTNEELITEARRWWAFLGENGSGKSCILQAISIALAGPEISGIMAKTGVTWSDFLRREGADKKSSKPISQGRIALEFTGGYGIDLRFNKSRHWWVWKGDRTGADPETRNSDTNIVYSGEPEIQTYVRAYGATRLLQSGLGSTAEPDEPRNVQIENLLDPKAEVCDAKSWLLSELSEAEFNVAAPVIANLLSDESFVPRTAKRANRGSSDHVLKRNRSTGEVTVDGIPIELASDGYKSIIAMACDIMRGFGANLSTMQSATGIVLIDEIGAHLHPRWQMAITTKLRRAFPNVQFIVSTHEPLCLRGLQSQEVIRVEKHREFGVMIEAVHRNPSRLRVDQLLTSEFFGLNSTIDPDLERRFQHYYQLLAIPPKDRTVKQKTEIQDLYRELYQRAPPSLGSTRRDQLIADMVDQYLADEKASSELTRFQHIKHRKKQRREILARVREIWDRRQAMGGSRGKRE